MSTSPKQENESVRDYVTRLMEEAVASKGEDYVYEQPGGECVYLDRECGQPSCLIGHVLVAAGVVIPPTLEGMSVHIVVRDLIPEWSVGQLPRALGAAQELQDSGATWGDALAEFKEVLGE